ncbi:MAG: outer membrane lipoprotein chaperone LolA, partial [Ketobacteraceae bacterium]|nr:outer membrane lipoprotein chaperone LolA [Ketobacteraceae bacterium]
MRSKRSHNLLSAPVIWVFLLALLGGGPASAGEKTQEVATDKLVEYLSAMNAMKATFHQYVEDSKKARLQDVTGKIWVKRPGKFRWDTNEPYPQSIITDGNVLWIYDVDLEQVTQKKLDHQVGNTPALLLSGNPETIGRNFTISAYEYEETGEWRFDLTPKSEDALFELLRVHFIEGRIRDMFLRDS